MVESCVDIFLRKLWHNIGSSIIYKTRVRTITDHFSSDSSSNFGDIFLACEWRRSLEVTMRSNEQKTWIDGVRGNSQTVIDIICTTSDSTPLSSRSWMVSLNVVFLTTSTTASILAFLALLAGSFLRLRVGLCKIYCNFSKNHLQKIIIFVNCHDGDDLGMEMMKIPWRLQLQRRRLPPSCLRDCGIDQLPCVFLFILIMKTFLCVKSYKGCWRWRRIAPSLRRLPWPCQRRSNGRGLQNRPGRGRWRKGD